MGNPRDAAFREFFAAEFPAAVRRAHVIVQDVAAAEDVAAEAFARLYARWKRVSEYEQPAMWIRLVVTRLAVRAAKGRLDQVRDEPMTDTGSDIDLQRSVRALPPQQRAAILLHYYDDLPVAEVAEVMGCKAATVKVHLHRARQTLKLTLEEETPDAIR